MSGNLQKWILELQSDDKEVATKAADALVDSGVTAIGHLCELTRDERWESRKAAAEVLGWIGPDAEPAVFSLERLLKDKSPEVRRQVAHALQSIDKRYFSRRRRRRFLKTLTFAALAGGAIALGEAHNVKGRLLGKLRGEVFFASQPASYWASRLSADDFGLLESAERDAIPVLVEIAKNPTYSTSVRQKAVAMLGRWEWEEPVPALISLLEDEDVRYEAAVALKHIGHKAIAAAPALQAQLDKTSSSNPFHFACAEAMRGIGGQMRGLFAPREKLSVLPGPKRCWIEFTADGKHLWSHRDDELIRYTDGERFTLRYGVRRSALHPDGRTAAVVDIFGGLNVFGLPRIRMPITQLDPLDELDPVPSDELRELVYSPDGKTLAVVSEGSLRFFDMTHKVPNERQAFVSLPKTGVSSVVFSGDGSTIAVRHHSSLPDSPLYSHSWWIFDTQTGKLVRKFSDEYGLGRKAALSNNGHYFAVKEAYSGIRVWDTRSGKTRSKLKTQDNYGAPLVFRFVDGRHIAVGHLRGRITIWDFATGKFIRELKWHNNRATIDGFAISPDGKTLASSDDYGWVKLWNLRELLPN